MKKGFTLIEVLSIIAVLAILSVITVPIFFRIIESVRYSSIRTSAYGLIDTADLYYAKYGQSSFECDGVSCTNAEDRNLYIKGSAPLSGTILTKSNSELYYVKIGKYCVLGNKKLLDIKKDCLLLDISNAEVDVSSLSATSKSIIIGLRASDNETGIKNITYEIDGKNYTDNFNDKSIDVTKKFDNLKANKKYTIKIIVTNGNNLKTTVTREISTLDFSELKIMFNNTPSSSSNGYFKKQEVYLNYESNDAEGYYIKSLRNAKSDIKTKKVCGEENSPQECNSEVTNDLAAGKWYYFDESPKIIYDLTSDSESAIYARVTNGVSISANASAFISKIDATDPNVTLDSASVTSKSIVVPITATDYNSGLGVITCKYSTTSGSYTTNANSVSESDCLISNITHNTTYYYQVCTTDKVGNELCKTGSAKTLALTVALNVVNSPTTAENGYYKSQVWSLTTTGNPVGYWIKSTRAAISDVNLVKTCGTDTDPLTCTDITATKSIAANTWYYTTSKPSITYNSTSSSTATLYARISDGKNTTANASASVSKIDVSGPNSISISTSSTKKTITATVTASDANSGIKASSAYAFSIDGGAYSSYQTSNSYTWTIYEMPIKSHTIKVKVKDKLDNVSESSGKTASLTENSTYIIKTKDKVIATIGPRNYYKNDANAAIIGYATCRCLGYRVAEYQELLNWIFPVMVSQISSGVTYRTDGDYIITQGSSGTINYNGSVFHISSGGAWLYEPFTITNKYNSYTYTNLNVQNNNCNVCLVDAATSLLNEYYK